MVRSSSNPKNVLGSVPRSSVAWSEQSVCAILCALLALNAVPRISPRGCLRRAL